MLTLIIAIFVPFYWATESGRHEAAQERQRTETIERGAEIYISTCASCHGSEGEGDIGPALKGTQLDEGALEKIIARGVPGTAMLAWSEEDDGPLKVHQVEDLVSFVKNWDSTLVTAGTGTLTPQPPPSPTVATSTGQGQAIFEQKCESCHSIGGGRLVGPDLKGVTEQRERDWLIRLIVSPERLIEQGDPIAEQLVAEYGISMPNLGLSDNDAEEVLAYIAAQSDGEPSPPPPEQDTDGVTPEQDIDKSSALPKGDASTGRSIFTGSVPLRNGGIACISCHSISGAGAIGGGTVGGDLTEAYSTLGESGLIPLLETTPFPIMTEIYAEKPLADDEIAHLVAFMQKVSGGREAGPAQSPLIFIIISVIGLLIVAGIFQLLWRRRLSGVRQPMVKGGSK